MQFTTLSFLNGPKINESAVIHTVQQGKSFIYSNNLTLICNGSIRITFSECFQVRNISSADYKNLQRRHDFTPLISPSQHHDNVKKCKKTIKN